MEWINYHHLLYFWTVVRLGSIAKASKELRLAQPTISGQIRRLEESLDVKLFTRVGRGLEPTETGRLVFRYADEMFSIGRELLDTLKGRPAGRPMRLMVGVSDAVPKLITHRLLAPALHMEMPVEVVCHENKTLQLLSELSIRELDLVIADAPLAGEASIKAYNHLLGQTGTTFFAAPRLAAKFRAGFPASLEGAPVLFPGRGTPLRLALDHWLETLDLRPRILAEFDDSALLKTFGQAGEGVFPGPSAIEAEIRSHYGVRVVGRTEDVVERFYAITIARRIKHPAVAEISRHARDRLFTR